jgi:hypothetical protein
MYPRRKGFAFDRNDNEMSDEAPTSAQRSWTKTRLRNHAPPKLKISNQI